MKWKVGDVILVSLPSYDLVGRVVNVDKKGDETAYLSFPFVVSVRNTVQGPIPSLSPLGVLLEHYISELTIPPCQYVYAGKVRKELNEIYSNLEADIQKQIKPGIEVTTQKSVDGCCTIHQFEFKK